MVNWYCSSFCSAVQLQRKQISDRHFTLSCFSSHCVGGVYPGVSANLAYYTVEFCNNLRTTFESTATDDRPNCDSKGTFRHLPNEPKILGLVVCVGNTTLTDM